VELAITALPTDSTPEWPPVACLMQVTRLLCYFGVVERWLSR